MTRETKVGLLVAMGVILLIGVLISDYLSDVQQQHPAPLTNFADRAQDSMTSGTVDANPQGRALSTGHRPESDPTTANRPHTPLLTPSELQIPPDQIAPEEFAAPRPVPDLPRAWELAMPPKPSSPRKGRSHTPQAIHYVKHRETLYTIARKHYGDGEYWPLIAEANHQAIRPNGHVRKNARLVIPVLNDLRGHETAQPAEGIGPPGHPSTTHAAAETYTVQSDDTLCRVAEKMFGDPDRWREVYDANRQKLDNPDMLPIGLRLRLPDLERSMDSDTAPVPLSSRYTARAANEEGAYIVQPLDTLYGISERTLGDPNRWRELYDANRHRLEDPHTLPVGRTLRIPS